MKVSPVHFAAIQAAFAEKAVEFATKYQEADLSFQRYLWDHLDYCKWVAETLAPDIFHQTDYTDAHIETALRRATLNLGIKPW